MKLIEHLKKHTPNAISLLRIGLTLVLMFLPLLSPLFLLIYLLAWASDILDGFLARRWGVESSFGARLDSAADVLLCGILLVRFIPAYVWPVWGLIWIGLIALVRAASLFVCYQKFHQLAFLHTYANKVTGFLLLCFPFNLRLFGLEATAITLCSAASLSAVEELFIQLSAKQLNLNQKSLFHKQSPEE